MIISMKKVKHSCTKFKIYPEEVKQLIVDTPQYCEKPNCACDGFNKQFYIIILSQFTCYKVKFRLTDTF